VTTERLAQLIRTRQPCVVLTGAGVSTESGIPDFRSADGIWSTENPLEVASIDGFRRDPARVWDFYARRLAVHGDAQPNDGHRALAELEALGLVEAVVTQNVDGLHQAAGSRNVVEVHGSYRGAVCLACSRSVGFDRLQELLPLPVCECGEVLKPGVVMFGELLPPGALERATELARGARLLLVVGSSLEVQPVASLPFDTLGAGGTLAIVNRGPTALDDHAELVLDGGAGALLRNAVDALR
jgi:NAD-dependent deacetylase